LQSIPTPKTIYIRRHAEKMLVEDSDPELAPRWEFLRSRKLAKSLAGQRNSSMYLPLDLQAEPKTRQWPTADQAGVQIGNL